MDILNLIVFLAIGALVGWLAGIIFKGRGFGLIGNIIIGVAGGVLGGVVFSFLGIITGGLFGAVFMATIGAVLLLLIISTIKKA